MDEAQRKANSKKNVAVIGSGPAGCTAALRLAQMGYKVTVFEKYAVPGGMLTWAIPEYRLPRPIILQEIDNIRRAGVDIQCNKALGKDFTIDDLLKKMGFSAVVLAIGAHRSRQMGIAGEDKPGVINGIDFLREVAVDSAVRATGIKMSAKVPDVKGKRVGVVGGGDVAIDAARVALRLGAREVHIMYRRTGDDMPATHLPEEIEAALHEGIRFHTMVNPIEVLGNGDVHGVRVQRQRLGEFDDTARRKPVPIAAETYTVNLDFLIPSIGQTPDLSCIARGEIETSRGSTFLVNEALGTSRAGVFAAGDAVTGPATIIQAVAQGNLVAIAVDEYIRTGKLVKPILVTPRHDIPMLHSLDDFAAAKRPEIPRLPVNEREGNFKEVEKGFSEELARNEASRCLRCDLEWLDLHKIPRPTTAVGSK